jgi:hypothetical protein
MSLIARSALQRLYFPKAEVMAGLSLGTLSLRIRFSFYSLVKVP